MVELFGFNDEKSLSRVPRLQDYRRISAEFCWEKLSAKETSKELYVRKKNLIVR